MSVRKNFRISEKEALILELYCQQEECTETAPVREAIRGLEKKLNPEYKASLVNGRKTITVG